MYFLIAGDTVPTTSNYDYFISGEVDNFLSDEIISLFYGAEFRIANLEVPLTNKRSPIIKCGPNLLSPIETINGLSRLKFDFFTLANNHINDQGPEGILSTIEALDKHNIMWGGVGKNLDSANKYGVFNMGAESYCIYCCAESEFSIAKENEWGANPFDLMRVYNDLVTLKNTYDYVIVLLHGGKECFRYPSPELQAKCHCLVDAGANLIVCQHSHCIGCEEKYNGSLILYGQGNFIFDWQHNEFWDTGFLLKVLPGCEVEYIPIHNCKGKIGILQQNESKQVLLDFFERSKTILDKEFLIKKYDELANSMASEYSMAFYGVGGKNIKTLVYKILNKLTFGKFQMYLFKKRSRDNIAMLINFIECESHRELLLRGLKNRINSK